MEGASQIGTRGARERKMFKIYSIMAAAALIAGALVVAPSLREVSASTRTDVTQTATGKGDRLDMAAPLARRPQGPGGHDEPQISFERRKPFTFGDRCPIPASTGSDAPLTTPSDPILSR